MMIYLFRKEMKKWHSVLWVVFASLALGGLSSLIVYRYRSPLDAPIAKVNGRSVPYKIYQYELSKLQVYIDSIRRNAQMKNLPLELFFNLYGLSNPTGRAMDTVIRYSLFDAFQESLGLVCDGELFKDALFKSIPHYLLNQDGTINVRAYRGYLAQMKTSVKEFEKNKEEEVKRDIIESLIQESCSLPYFQLKEEYLNIHTPKKFTLVKVPFETFLKNAEKESVGTEDLKRFYNDHQENYRVPEKRKVHYFVISLNDYSQNVTIDDESIERFYERNKNTLYRVSPKVKVRRLLIKEDEDRESDIDDENSPEMIQAQSLHAQLTANPSKFADLARKYSQDSESASKGGLLDFFEKGTYDQDFEREAFRLQKEGDISPVITTDDGYEIIQLVDRTPSSIKPLSAVRAEVIKALKLKRATHELNRDITELIKKLKTEPQALAQFADKHHLKTVTTDWLSQQASINDPVQSLLLKKIFEGKRKDAIFGFVPYGEDFVVYRVADVKESVIPAFGDVEKLVRSDYFADKAHKQAHQEVGKVKAEFFNKKGSLADLAKAHGFDVSTTDFIPRSAASLGRFPAVLVNQVFLLNSPEQLYSQRNGLDWYMAQLIQTQPIEVPQEKLDLVKKENLDRRKSLYYEALIASLMRTAKIEKYVQNTSSDVLPSELED